MLKARHIWYINAILAIIALFIVYRIWFSPKQDAWRLIPDNAFLVIESTSLQKNLYEKTEGVSEALSEIPFFYDALEKLRLVGNELPNDSLRKKLFDKKLISFSLHREAKRNLEYIVYIPLENNDAEVKMLIANNAANKRMFTQTTSGINITHLKKEGTEVDFSYFVHDDYMICSRSVLLLEAVIDKITSRKPALDKVPFKESRNSVAHLYLKTRNLMDIADVLPTQLSPNLRSYFRNITPFNPDMVFSQSSDNENIEGYVLSNIKIEVPFLSALGNQKATAFTTSELIPENTAFFLRTSFNKPTDLRLNMNVYLGKKDEDFQSKKDSVSKLLEKDIDSIFDFMSQEAIFCEMETIADESSQKIALFYASKPVQAIDKINEFSVATEPYFAFKTQPVSLMNHVVRKLEISDFPALLFGSSFSGFQECFYTLHGSHIVFANSQESMENYLSKLSIGQTWRRSKIHDDLVKRLSSKAQVTAILSPQRIWNNIFFSLPDKWQESVLKHEGRFKNIRLIAIENFVSKEQFATKLHIQKNQASNPKIVNQLLLQESTPITSPIIGSPYLIVNPNTRKEEVLLQTDNFLFLSGTPSKAQNSVQLQQAILPSIQAIDFYQNGRLQHVARTENQLFILERTGKEFTSFSPNIPISGNGVAFTNLTGKVYWADAAGNIFKVTNTKNISRIPIKLTLNNILNLKAFPYKNTEMLGVLLKDGSIYVFFEQNGVVLKNFPTVPLQTRPVGMVTEIDENGNPTFTLLSEMGEIKTITMEGNVIPSSEIQLIKDSKSANFEIINAENSTDWLVLQRSSSGVVAFNKKGEELLKIDSPFSYNLKISYFNLGNDLRILCIFDGKNNSLFDLKGNQIGGKLLPATALPYLSFEDYYNKILIYNPNGSTLEKWGIKIK